MNAAPVTIRREGGFAWQTAFSRKELTAVLVAMRAVCGLDAMPLEVVLANDAEIGEANAAYLGCIGPTNILSFPPFFGPSLGASASGLGLMALSLDAVNREALLYGQNREAHAIRLLAHGMAHLSGLDHGEAMDGLEAAAMEAGLAVWDQIRA